MAKRVKKSNGSAVLFIVGTLAFLAYNHGNTRGDTAADPGAHPGAGREGRYVVPVAIPPGRLTSGFGARWGTTHYGIDLAAPVGTPIRAVTAGTVIEAGPASGFGLWMRLRHPDGTVTVYGHMHTIDRSRGARVAAGERIATVGARGQSTGPHLHFEVWPHGDRSARIDPKPWLAARGIHL